MWIEYNPNPTGRRVGDCSVRAISKALKVDWETAYAMMPMDGRSYNMDGDRSYARNRRYSYAPRRRDAMGRYSRADVTEELRDIMDKMPDDASRMKIQRIINEM